MKGDERIIGYLNDYLTRELTIVNQYFLGAKMMENWGLDGLAKVFRDVSFDEMRDAERIIERILYLEGHPNLQRLSSVNVGEDPVEHLRLAAESERSAIETLRQGVELAVEVGDYGTRGMVAEMLEEEEEHLYFFERQLQVVERIGVENYLGNYVS
ncbi:MAG: bacterioferritin [Actinomycetota bacterium]|nr:bacterioferritin [Actinomycetota bacterium]